MVTDSFVEQVFNAMSYKTALFRVWFCLILRARRNTRTVDLDSLAESLRLNRQTVRRCVRILGRLGLTSTCRSGENHSFRAIYVRAVPSTETDTLLSAIAAGYVTINMGTTKVTDTRSGLSLDQSATVLALARAFDPESKHCGIMLIGEATRDACDNSPRSKSTVYTSRRLDLQDYSSKTSTWMS